MTEKEKIYTCCVLDTETGGLSPNTAAITQVSCQVIRMDTFEVVGVFDKYIKPYKKGNFDVQTTKKLRKKREIESEEDSYFEYGEKAMAVTGLSFDFLMKNGSDIHEVANEFIAFIKKCTIGSSRQYKPVIVAQNGIFDLGFLQHMFHYTGQTKEFESVFQGTKDMYGNFIPAMMDTLVLSRLAFCNDPSITSCTLGNVSEKLKIELVDAHSSMADVEATSNIFSVFINRMRNEQQQEDNGDESVIKSAEKTRVHFKI